MWSLWKDLYELTTCMSSHSVQKRDKRHLVSASVPCLWVTASWVLINQNTAFCIGWKGNSWLSKLLVSFILQGAIVQKTANHSVISNFHFTWHCFTELCWSSRRRVLYSSCRLYAYAAALLLFHGLASCHFSSCKNKNTKYKSTAWQNSGVEKLWPLVP